MSSDLWFEGFVPAWARRAVWYQIFPERFWNGDASNDPRIEDQAGGYPFDGRGPWQPHPWTSDFYAQQPYEKALGKPWAYTIHRRRYGGDLQGILDRLDYLEDLGVTALYLNPIFDAPSHHKYDGSSYHHVDPTLGPDSEGDRRLMDAETPEDPATWRWTAADTLLLKLIDSLHRRGMRIILDGVFNHMGTRSFAFRDLVQNQQRSRFRDWFKVIQWRDDEKGLDFDYEGWWGVKSLPELRQDDDGPVAGPRAYILAATRRWLDPDGDGNPADGIDGWRLDVAFCIRHPFWKEWKAFVRSINPDAYTVAEVNRPPEQCEHYLRGDEFDAVMNYNFVWHAAEFLWEGRADAARLAADLAALRAAYPPEVAWGLQNLGDSHDTARIATLAFCRDRIHYLDWPNAGEQMRSASGLVDVRRPDAAAWQRTRLFALLQMTWIGAPMVYYGAEAGMWGPNDPDTRKPMVWPELRYENEIYTPNGSTRPVPDPVEFDHELHGWYKRLIALRRGSEALMEGDVQVLHAAGDLFAFARTASGETVVVAINRGESAQEVALPAPGQYADLLGGGEVAAGSDGMLRLPIPACEGLILSRRS